MEVSVIDPWPEIQRNNGYSPSFLDKVRQERIRRQSEALKKQERVRACKRLRNNGAPAWVRDIILQTADLCGISPGDIVFGLRTYEVVDARHAAIYEVKATKPSLSSTQIGKWFGIDHTTVLNALAAHAHKTGSPSLTTYRLRPRYGYRAEEYRGALDRGAEA